MKWALMILVLSLVPTAARAMDGFSAAAGVMALTNSSKQGGQSSAGSTILTEADVSDHFDWWAVGLYTQLDKQGANETDLALGPRLELTYDPFYFEAGYAVLMHRSFVDRAIAEQTGSGYTLGLGARFPLDGGPTFLQFSYEYRIEQVTKQDGAKLDEPITQVDGYPLFGVGVSF